MLLGDRVEQALASIGVTKELVENWLGPECGCDWRQEQLNLLDKWARKTLSNSISAPKELLYKMLGEETHE